MNVLRSTSPPDVGFLDGIPIANPMVRDEEVWVYGETVGFPYTVGQFRAVGDEEGGSDHIISLAR